MSHEWYDLYEVLRKDEYRNVVFKNSFYNRLVTVMKDLDAGLGDICGAYRDALMACPKKGVAYKDLPLQRLDPDSTTLFDFGLLINSAGYVELDATCHLSSDEGPLDLKRVYDGTIKSKIQKFPIDPSLTQALNDSDYLNYNGRAQQMAVRLSLLAEANSTTIINLPTGTGKTLVPHALCIFAPANKLTLVIVPTTALAIDQGNRAKSLLEKTGEYRGSCHYWHSGQEEQQHNDIKESIRGGRQRILFVSPEAACKSLLIVLFELAKVGTLENVVLDEAHMVDEWGSEFRPYYQILSPILRSLRSLCPGANGIKCFLMSATFTDKSIDTVRGLFASQDKPPVEIHGGFLRPEIQYSVRKVAYIEYVNAVLTAARLLPKPLIIYVIKPEEAESLSREILRCDTKRVNTFTGKTPDYKREELLKLWSAGEIDVMVATSAFGMGVDKSNVRSILHAGVPTNMDTFYQQVGRGGRDGCGCQSLLIYHPAQKDDAERLNSITLITAKLGAKRWSEMWRLGHEAEDVDRVLSLRAQHADQRRSNTGNVMWNWKTLLLMERAGMIRLIMDEPDPPDWDPTALEADNIKLRDQYFDVYYNQIKANVLVGDLDGPSGWEGRFEEQRDLEYRRTSHGFHSLWMWITQHHSRPLCAELAKFYTVTGILPEKVCGGCPGCRASGVEHEFIPTCGSHCHVRGVRNDQNWSGLLASKPVYSAIYYDASDLRDPSDPNRIVSEWTWIFDLMNNRSIIAIRADSSVLAVIGKRYGRSKGFWIGIPTEDDTDTNVEWPELVLLMPRDKELPKLRVRFTPRLLVAPEDIRDSDTIGNLWWEKANNVSSLKFFREGLL